MRGVGKGADAAHEREEQEPANAWSISQLLSPDRCFAASGASVQSSLRVGSKYPIQPRDEPTLAIDEEARSCRLSK
jgi:hypothetical protein